MSDALWAFTETMRAKVRAIYRTVTRPVTRTPAIIHIWAVCVTHAHVARTPGDTASPRVTRAEVAGLGHFATLAQTPARPAFC